MATFSIAGIIQSIDNQLYCYDTSFRTYKEALVFSDNTLKMTVVLKGTLNSGRSTYKFINMTLLLNNYLAGKGEMVEYCVNNWDDLAKFLTDLYNASVTVFNKYLTYSPAPRYQHYKVNGIEHTRITPFITNMTETIDIKSLAYTTDITASYVNKDAPEIRDLPHRRISLPDLVFTKASDDVSFNFENTLVSVDGIVCYPIYSETTDELYACNGARFLKNTTDSNSFNILLMDFTNLGTLHHYKLSDCKQELVIKAGDKVWLYDNANKIADTILDSQVQYWQQAQYSMKFKLPIGAVNGYPILCLAGRMFFPGVDDLTTYTEGGYICVEFHISNAVLENIIASNLQHQNLFFQKSAMFRTILSYVFCNIFIDQAYQYDEGSSEWLAIQFYMDQIIPFITIVETDKNYGIDRIKGIATGKFGKIIFPSYSKGILMNQDTREFIDYTRISYKDQTLVTFTPQNSLFIQKREGTNTNNDLMSSDATTYDDMIEFAPQDIDLVYNTREHRFKIHVFSTQHEATGKKAYVTTWSQSNAQPYEVNESNYAVPYTWQDILPSYTTYTWEDIVEEFAQDYPPRTPVAIFDTATKFWYVMDDDVLAWISSVDPAKKEDSYETITWYRAPVVVRDTVVNTWYSLDDNGLVNWESEVDAICTPTSFAKVTWYKVLNYLDAKVLWYNLADGTQPISDGVRTDRMAWQLTPFLYIDPYNRYYIGEFIKDPHHYELLDICIEGESGSTDLLDDEDNPIKQPDPTDDLTNPMNPVLTAEYELVDRSITKGVGTAPAAITKLKVEPVFESTGVISTTLINVKNGTNIGEEYAKYDGKYLLKVSETVGIERVWLSQNVANVVIKYVPAQGAVPSHWGIFNNDTEVFATDYADEGSSPYTSNLTWRLI